MQRVLIVILLIFLLVACGGGDGDQVDSIPTLAPTADLQGRGGGEGAPRVTETPDPGLPPTWTPVPTADSNQTFTGSVTGSTGGNINLPGAVVITDTRLIHIVQRGDTLSKLAIRYSVPVTDLARINNIVNWDVIEVGQELIIPATGAPAP